MKGVSPDVFLNTTSDIDRNGHCVPSRTSKSGGALFLIPNSSFQAEGLDYELPIGRVRVQTVFTSRGRA